MESMLGGIVGEFVSRSDAPSRQCWADIALPYRPDGYPTYLMYEDSSQLAPAVRGRVVGKEAVIFHVPLAFTGAQGRLLGTFREPEQDEVLPAFNLSDWVSDDLTAILPIGVVVWADGTQSEASFSPLKAVGEPNNACLEYECLANLGRGLWQKVFLKVYSLQDAVQICFGFVWSDRNDPNWSTQITSLYVKSKEYLKLEYGPRIGVTEPVSADGYWWIELSKARLWGDGQMLGPYWGQMLCLPTTIKPAELFSQQRINNLVAWLSGGVEGSLIYEEWDRAGEPGILPVHTSSWGPFGSVPVIPTGFDAARRDDYNNQRAEAFRQRCLGLGDMWDGRPMGLAKTPGQTGGQDEFNSVQRPPDDPREIHEWRYSISDQFRGLCHLEADGSMLRFADHPDWRTWSGLSHPANNECKDTLGKSREKPGEIPGSGFTGIDQQHYGKSLICAVYALTGDRMLEQILRHTVETDLATHQWFMDTPRAARALLAWGHMYKVLDDQRLKPLAQNRIALYEAAWIRDKTLKCLMLGSDPTLGHGKKAIIVWEHALNIVGCEAALMMLSPRPAVITEIDRYMTAIMEMIRDHGCGQDAAGKWHCYTAIEWNGGEPGGAKAPGDGGWFIWIGPAIVLLASRGDAKAQEILDAFLPNGPETWEDSEWLTISESPWKQVR